jgi:hypothetical protein
MALAYTRQMARAVEVVIGSENEGHLDSRGCEWECG